MNVADLERRISELLESMPTHEPPYPGMLDILQYSDLRAWQIEHGDGGLKECEDGEVRLVNWKPRKWTGSEDASAMLLELLPFAKVTRTVRMVDGKIGDWLCESNACRYGNEKMHADRKTAIALAALQWLESLTPDERQTLQAKSHV